MVAGSSETLMLVETSLWRDWLVESLDVLSLIDATFDMNAVPELFSTTSDVNIVLCAGFCEAGIVL